MENNKTVTKIL